MASMKMTALLDVVPCSLFEVDWRFRGVSASIIMPMLKAGITSETSVSFYYTIYLFICSLVYFTMRF
jgi:hypothetical protein